MGLKEVPPVEELLHNDDGTAPVIHMASSEANDDWIRAARLLRENTDEAKEEFNAMDNTPMVSVVEE